LRELNISKSRFSRELSGLMRKLGSGMISRICITVCGRKIAVMITKQEYDSVSEKLNRTSSNIGKVKKVRI
jgi:PHD/YefM family antitoxin component YafN of YafNO toxin-antitoxin module